MKKGIPNGGKIRELLDALPRFHWLRPKGDEANDEIIGQLVAEHIDTLNDYGAVQMATIRIESNRAAARAVARDAARVAVGDAARAVARDADWAAARDAAWDAAKAVTRDVVWAAVWAAAWDAAWDAARAVARDVAWAAPWDAASAASHLASGLGKADPWQPLMELWARGTWPVGYLKDGSFLVYRPVAK